MSGPLSAALTALCNSFADGGIADRVRDNQINLGGVLTPRLAGWLAVRAETEGRGFGEVAAASAREGGFTR
jgi:hypothetical protein